jgi:hypothetical protein
MPDNDDICATGWLGLALSDYILVSLIALEYADWHQRISHRARRKSHFSRISRQSHVAQNLLDEYR